MIRDPYKHLPKDIRKTSALMLYRQLVTPRLIEEKMLRLIRQGRLAKWFSGYGQEAIAVGCAIALASEDVILPMHRNLGVFTTRGIPLKPLFCQLMGKEGGFTKGRDRTFHFGKLDDRVVGMISHLAAMLPVACGFGLAAQLEKSRKVALAFIGEGATREGDFHEALSLAAAWKLPVIFVIENNGYGLSTPTKDVIPVENLADAAVGYGMPGFSVDGNDLLAVINAVQKAAKEAREGNGPALLEMKTFRMRGHEEASGVKYVPPHLFEEWTVKDPIQRFKTWILGIKGVSENDLEAIEEEVTTEIESAVQFAFSQPEVISTLENELADVYAPAPVRYEPVLMPDALEKRFIDGVTDALRLAMQKDEKVLLMGQDIAAYGGVFKVTDGFMETFGAERVRNTPIMESGVVGAALGLALEGFKPVVEIQYADFITCGFNQIVNNLATTHYRWGAPVNVTIRAPFGGYIGAGPFHSQSPEAWFCHVPGLKVVVPSTPADAKGLLMAAIEEPNPVLVFEHKFLYRNQKGRLPEGDHYTPIGKARVVQSGDALTLVTWGLGVRWAMEEWDYWQNRGVKLEIIDLRTLVPWDRETVLHSIQKTNRLLVLHEAQGSGGFGAEVTSAVVEAAFAHLDAPPKRVTGADFPIAFSTQIEQEVYAAKARLRKAINEVLQY
ncbi:MAG: dehydrogenase E1 component subunit alpha/beta [Bacteroidetes Order II. Incertae sedis bacterium]|nr:dehydrogenase E1 component subunit alpha/beta [Bacteroidetes Order II. bacterium]